MKWWEADEPNPLNLPWRDWPRTWNQVLQGVMADRWASARMIAGMSRGYWSRGWDDLARLAALDCQASRRMLEGMSRG